MGWREGAWRHSIQARATLLCECSSPQLEKVKSFSLHPASTLHMNPTKSPMRGISVWGQAAFAVASVNCWEGKILKQRMIWLLVFQGKAPARVNRIRNFLELPFLCCLFLLFPTTRVSATKIAFGQNVATIMVMRNRQVEDVNLPLWQVNLLLYSQQL